MGGGVNRKPVTNQNLGQSETQSGMRARDSSDGIFGRIPRSQKVEEGQARFRLKKAERGIYSGLCNLYMKTETRYGCARENIMARNSVSGRTKAQLADMRREWLDEGRDKDFDEHYCLAKIPRQPEDYDGPPRFCVSHNTRPVGDNWLCKHHGGAKGSVAGEPRPEEEGKELDRKYNPANMKHGMKAARENLVDDFDDKDLAIYDWVVDKFSDAYDLNPEADPAVALDLHRLAAEVVRGERGRGVLLEEGEVQEKPIKDEDGVIVTDNQGNVKTEKSQHYLADMMHRQDNKITKLEKSLSITRKERLKRDSEADRSEAIKELAQIGKGFLDRESKEYDPQDKPWESDDGE